MDCAAPIHAAVLAYGNRPHTLRAVLDALARTFIPRVVVIANAVGQETRELLEAARGRREAQRIDVHYSDLNLGSAGGFARAVDEAFADPHCAAVWLLDDDNVPVEGAYEILAAAWSARDDEETLFACLRPGLPEYAHPDARQLQVLPLPGSCVGFHVGRLLNRRRVPLQRAASGRLWLAHAPYGGLLVPRTVVARHGGPDPAFFLYGDDLEWTTRLTGAGCRIELLENACVIDADDPWNATGGRMSNLRRRIEVLSPVRVYYETRNRVWLSLHRFPVSRWMYRLNKLLYLASACILAVRAGRWERYGLIRRAIADGEAGRLEQVNDLR